MVKSCTIEESGKNPLLLLKAFVQEGKQCGQGGVFFASRHPE